MKTFAIILASGTGSRFGSACPKQFIEIFGKPIVGYTLDVCLQTREIDEIIIVVSAPYIDFMTTYVNALSVQKPIRVIEGGASRWESCKKGVAAITETEAKILIHNGVQPFVSTKTFLDCINALDHYSAVSVGSPCVYTILELNDKRELERIVPRVNSVNDLGPECFLLSLVKKVFEIGMRNEQLTNLTAVVLNNRLAKVYVINGDPSNMKITYPDDVLIAERMIKARGMARGSDNMKA